jgi:WD40 repeat protein
VQFSPDGQLLATASGDRTVKLWETQSWQLRATLQRHSTFVRALAFFPDGKTLATGSDDQTIKLWDLENSLETGLERATLRGHQQAVTALAVSSALADLGKLGWHATSLAGPGSRSGPVGRPGGTARRALTRRFSL